MRGPWPVSRSACRHAHLPSLRGRSSHGSAAPPPPPPRPTLRFSPACRSTLWRYLFGRQARDLEQSNTAEDEYMIGDSDLWITKYVSVPKEMGHLNPAAFVAGIVRGVLDGGGFPARCARRAERRQAGGCAACSLPCCPACRTSHHTTPASHRHHSSLLLPPHHHALQGDGALCAGAGPGAPQDRAPHEVSKLCRHPGARGAPGRQLTPAVAPPLPAPAVPALPAAAGSPRGQPLAPACLAAAAPLAAAGLVPCSPLYPCALTLCAPAPAPLWPRCLLPAASCAASLPADWP